MCKIPDSLNPRLYQPLCNLRRLCLRDRQRSHLNIVILDKLLQIIYPANLDSPDNKTDQSGIDIKHTFNDKSALFKISIIGNRLPKISCTNNNHMMLSVNSQNFSNFRIKIFNIIAVALLTKSSKIIQILANLRCSYFHSNTQLIG